MSNLGGGPAYPGTYEIPVRDEWIKLFRPGMTMRQRYKIAVLTGLVQNRIVFDHYTGSELAGICGLTADAMLAEDEAHEREEGVKE